MVVRNLDFRFSQHWPQKLNSSGTGHEMKHIGSSILEEPVVSICRAEDWNTHRGSLIITKALIRVVLFLVGRCQGKKLKKKKSIGEKNETEKGTKSAWY